MIEVKKWTAMKMKKKKDYDAPMSVNCTFISTVF